MKAWYNGNQTVGHQSCVASLLLVAGSLQHRAGGGALQEATRVTRKLNKLVKFMFLNDKHT